MVHNPFYNGITVTVMAQFEFEKFCSVVQNHRITYAYVVPPVILLLGKHPVVSKYDLSSLRMLSSGAAPLTQDLVKTVYRKINVPIKQGYGLTETSPVIHSQVSYLYRFFFFGALKSLAHV
jgi:acyl-coenzyme A synthetase/AMP-(fatty) acid ligase